MFRPDKNDYIDFYLTVLDQIRGLNTKKEESGDRGKIDSLLDARYRELDTYATALKSDYGMTDDDLLDTRRLRRSRDRVRPCVIAPAAAKGGSGKTALSVNMASILASRGYRVLLIDIDEQCNSTLSVGISLRNITKIRRSCAELFDTDLRGIEGLCLKPLPDDLPTLDLIPSTFLLMYKERDLINLREKTPELEARILSRNMLRNRDFFDRYDFVVFDTKPSLSQVNENCFASLDTLIAVTDAGYNSLAGLSTLMGYWDHVARDIRLSTPYSECIVLNKLQNANIDREIYALLKGEQEYADGRGAMQPVDPNMIDFFGEYHRIFVDCPIRQRTAVREREKLALPLVIETQRAERDTLAMYSTLIDTMFSKGLLFAEGGDTDGN